MTASCIVADSHMIAAAVQVAEVAEAAQNYDTGTAQCIMPLTGIVDISISQCDMTMLGSCTNKYCTALPSNQSMQFAC